MRFRETEAFFRISENSSVGRARPCQGRGRGFESRFPLSGKGREACPDENWEVSFPAQKNLSLNDERFFCVKILDI